MLYGEEGEKVALGDGLLVLAWKFDVVVARCRPVPGVSSVGFDKFAKSLFAVCVRIIFAFHQRLLVCRAFMTA